MKVEEGMITTESVVRSHGTLQKAGGKLERSIAYGIMCTRFW